MNRAENGLAVAPGWAAIKTSKVSGRRRRGRVAPAFTQERASYSRKPGQDRFDFVRKLRPGKRRDDKERRRPRTWKGFLEWAQRYAMWRLSFVRWRGEEGGVPPEGFDAESVAMEAVLVVGRGREGAGKEWRGDRKAVARAIRRLVDRLKHRREVWTTSSEPDLGWVVLEEGEEEAVRAAEQVPGTGASAKPGDELVAWERVNEFKHYLGADKAARELVDCYCGNVTSRKEIGRFTGLSWKEVKNARERVRAKWKRFRTWEECRERNVRQPAKMH